MPRWAASGEGPTTRRPTIPPPRRPMTRPTRPRWNAYPSPRKNTIRGAWRGPRTPTRNRNRMMLTFRCPRELEGLLAPPVPAAQGMPDWFKAMPPQAFNAVSSRTGDTVKRCPPFIDAMTSGFLIPLICDVRVENGEFTWDNDLPPGGAINFVRSPIGFHDSSQVSGTPLFDPDRFLIKFHNLWTIEAPEGYALLFTHPANRFDLPFTTLTGLVDSDRYHDNFIHFPA